MSVIDPDLVLAKPLTAIFRVEKAFLLSFKILNSIGSAFGDSVLANARVVASKIFGL